MKMSELPSCPFCGAEPELGFVRYKMGRHGKISTFGSSKKGLHKDEWREYTVKCSNEDCGVWPGTAFYKAPESAKRRWAKRA